jgi:hypothetical protein
MRSIEVPAGTVFGRWTVIEEAPANGKRGMRSRCECGTIAIVAVGHLRSGRSASCGCANRVDVPPGAAFGHLTAISETRVNGRRAMLCQCDCGEQRTAALGELRSGSIRVCGPMHGVAADAAKLNPGEVPLYGKLARGRVALVDPEDMPLVMQYRWNVWEYRLKHQGNQPAGPYAIASPPRGGGPKKNIRMHNLIMGTLGVDHRNGDGLDNQKSNLREADQALNTQNRRPNLPGASAFKGVQWEKREGYWIAKISDRGLGQSRYIGSFANELEAAYAYDAAARNAFGEFAWPNFPDGPTRAMVEQWEAEREGRREAAAQAEFRTSAQWWAQREPQPRVCVMCGGNFQSKKITGALYCGSRCKKQAALRRAHGDRQQEGGLP